MRIKDSVRGTVEVKLRKAVRAVDDATLRRNIENEVRADPKSGRRRNSQEWNVANAHKDLLLKQFASLEQMATDLDRARSICRLMGAIAASRWAPAELLGSLELMALMADWLDPMVKAPWPEVDGVGDKNPHGGLW